MKTLLNICLVLAFCLSTPLSIFGQKAVRNAKSTNDKDANDKIIQNNVWDNLGILMVNLLDDKSTPVWLFEEGTKFKENKDRTASITGTIVQFGKSNRRFELELTLSGRRDIIDADNPPYGFLENTNANDWHFYETIDGTLKGLGALKNGVLKISGDDNRPYFQIGSGANQIKQDSNLYGAAGWFRWDIIENSMSGLRLQAFPQRSPILDRGGIHFLTNADTCNSDANTDLFSVANTSGDCEITNSCGQGFSYSGFIASQDSINGNLFACNTRLKIDENLFTASFKVKDPTGMTGSIDIKSLVFSDESNTLYTFDLESYKKESGLAIQLSGPKAPCGRTLTDVSSYKMKGNIKIGASLVTIDSSKSFIQYGTVANGPDAGKQGTFGVLYFTGLDGKPQAIEFVNVLDTVPNCIAPLSFATRSIQLDFYADAQNGDAHLKWINNSGDKNDYFIVQKLDELGDFKDIETVNGDFKDGNKYFSTFDRQITEGEQIYRLKLVFQNGSYVYSDIQTIQFESIKNVVISPNPADDHIQIDVRNYRDTPVSIFIYNSFGQAVLSQITDSNHANTIRLDTNELQTGQYLARVVSKNKKDVLKKIMIIK